MASPNSDLQVNKQVIFTFTKLASYEKAERKVASLLEEVVDGSDVRIVRYDEVGKYQDASAVTGIVVIDVRQTRTLITPTRRDKNVDHWDELHKLASDVTKPAGSLLLFLYGDEDEPRQLIRENWMSTWRYNDDRAYGLAQAGRVFSFGSSLNTKQKKVLGDFLSNAPLFPQRNRNTNVLLLGDEEAKKEVCDCLDRHPHVRKTWPNNAADRFEYQYFSFIGGQDQEGGPAIKVYCGDMGCIKLCDSQDNTVALSEQISAEHLRGREITNRVTNFCTCCNPFSTCCSPCSTCCCREYAIPPIDNVLFSCHCDICFKLSHDRQVSDYIRTELGKVGIKVLGDVRPLPESQIAASESVEDTSRSVIVELKRQDNESHIEEKQRRLLELSSDIVKQMYIYHVMQTPAARSRVRRPVDEKHPRDEEHPEDGEHLLPDNTNGRRPRFRRKVALAIAVPVIALLVVTGLMVYLMVFKDGNNPPA